MIPSDLPEYLKEALCRLIEEYLQKLGNNDICMVGLKEFDVISIENNIDVDFRKYVFNFEVFVGLYKD